MQNAKCKMQNAKCKMQNERPTRSIELHREVWFCMIIIYSTDFLYLHSQLFRNIA